MILLIGLLTAFTLLLAGCSGGFSSEDDDGDGASGGGTLGDNDDNDSPSAALGVIVASLGFAGAIRRRNL